MADSVASSDIAIYGTVVEFACNPGFRFSDNKTINMVECIETGTWNTSLSDCIGEPTEL